MNIYETVKLLEQFDNVLLLTHVRPDGDTIGCAAALCQALRDMGKTAFLLYNEGITSTYERYAAPYWAPEEFVPGHVVSVDIATLGLLPENAQPYAQKIELAIDHHPSQEFFAPNVCLEADSAACGEIVYEIVRQLTAITPAIATAIYVAVSTDTGCFQYANTTPRTHRIAAEVMALVDVADINKALFRSKSITRLKMEAWMVSHMELYDDDRVVVMQIPIGLRASMRATEADIEELSALAPQVQGTDCGITLREMKGGRIKVSVRSGPRVDACAVCRKVGGGGHFAAAGATVEGTLTEVKEKILQAVKEVTETAE